MAVTKAEVAAPAGVPSAPISRACPTLLEGQRAGGIVRAGGAGSTAPPSAGGSRS
ncbi:hypothetical protein ACWFQ8_20130 [Streptomyces sp. NPDC055254]